VNAKEIREMSIPIADYKPGTDIEMKAIWLAVAVVGLVLLREAAAQLADLRHEIHHQTEETTRGGDPR
jgi:hypothetical protein